jgi:endonuclease/exonuclease/phosphatase family metal-dependent hydrolase
MPGLCRAGAAYAAKLRHSAAVGTTAASDAGGDTAGDGAAVVTQLKLQTWNIHSGRGRDGRYDLERIEQVLREEDADIIALQEVDRGVARSDLHDQAQRLADGLGRANNFCATWGDGSFGLAVLTRLPAKAVHPYDLSYGLHREPRACLRVDLDTGTGHSLHVFNCHLGLATLERRFQRRRMLSDALLLSEELNHPVVLMGDFNDRPLSVVHSQLRRHFSDAFRAAGCTSAATFRFGPLGLKLDHIYVSREVQVRSCGVRTTGAASLASDHYPLIAEIELPLGPRAGIAGERSGEGLPG